MNRRTIAPPHCFSRWEQAIRAAGILSSSSSYDPFPFSTSLSHSSNRIEAHRGIFMRRRKSYFFNNQNLSHPLYSSTRAVSTNSSSKNNASRTINRRGGGKENQLPQNQLKKDPYVVLGVSRLSSSKEDIKSAYKRKAMVCFSSNTTNEEHNHHTHPQQQQQQQQVLKDRFCELATAYVQIMEAKTVKDKQEEHKPQHKSFTRETSLSLEEAEEVFVGVAGGGVTASTGSKPNFKNSSEEEEAEADTLRRVKEALQQEGTTLSEEVEEAVANSLKKNGPIQSKTFYDIPYVASVKYTSFKNGMTRREIVLAPLARSSLPVILVSFAIFVASSFTWTFIYEPGTFLFGFIVITIALAGLRRMRQRTTAGGRRSGGYIHHKK